MANKVLVKNFSYLSVLQVFNMLIPLITYPYLIRVIGKDIYGLVVFAQAIVSYLAILVSFGFHISAVKQISIHRDDKDKINEIVSSVLTIKTLLLVVSFILLGSLLIFIPQAHGYEPLFLLCMWFCVYDVIFPIWYFQGIEQMKYITYITLVSRLTFLGLIFVFIHTNQDYLFIPIINGVGAILAGITSLFIIFGKHKICFHFQPISVLKFYLKDSLPIFISNVSSKIYVSSNKVIVGAFLGMSEVAYYDLAEKLTTILKIPQGLVSQSIFPKISKERNTSFVKRIAIFSIAFHIILYLLVLLFSKHIIMLLGGTTMLNAVFITNILAISFPVIAMSNVFGVQLLVPFGYNKKFSQIIVASGLIYFTLALLIWLTIGFSLINITLMTVVTEIFVTSVMFYYCKKYKLWI